MSNSKIRVETAKLLHSNTSETHTMLVERTEENEYVVTNTYLRTLPESRDYVPSRVINTLMDVYIEHLREKAELLAESYLSRGLTSRVQSYSFAITWVREPDYCDLCLYTPWFSLTKSDKRRMARYAELLLADFTNFIDGDISWELARVLR